MTVYSLQNLEVNAGEMEELMQHVFSLKLDLYGTGWRLLHVVTYMVAVCGVDGRYKVAGPHEPISIMVCLQHWNAS